MTDWRDTLAVHADQPTSAIRQSDASGDWREQLGLGAASDDWRDRLGLGGGGQQPTPDMPPDMERLDQARQQLTRDQQVAAGIGLDDPAGEPPQGIVSQAFDYLHRPLSAVAGGIAGLAGYEMDDDFDDAGLGEQVVGRMGAALRGDEQYSARDMPMFDVDEDASVMARMAAGAGAFATDVMLDPLTYVSFGGTVLGKRLGSEVVQRSASARAPRELDPQTLDRWADEALRFRAPREAAADTTLPTAVREYGGRAGADALEPPQTWIDRGGTRDTWRRWVGQEQFGDAAAEAYQRGGPTGLRKWLADEEGANLGQEAAERVFSDLPRDVQGGLRIRRPFDRSGPGGTPRTIGIGGGGRIAEGFGAEGALESIHRLRNRIRGSAVGRAVADRLTGRHGRIYGQMIRDLSERDPRDLSRTTYSSFRTVQDVQRQAEREGAEMFEQTRDAFGRMESAVRHSGGDEDKARDALRRWFQDPDELTEMLRGGNVRFGDRMVHGPDVEHLSVEERAGIFAAWEAHQFLRAAYDRMRTAGVPVNRIDEYVPRILTQEEMLRKHRAKPTRPSMGQRGRVSGYQPDRERRQFIEAYTDVDEAGEPVLRTRHLTPEEANEASGRNVFETDPSAVVTAYGDAARRLATRHRIANAFHEHAAFPSGDTEWQRIVAGRPIEELAEGLNESVQQMHNRLRELRAHQVGTVESLQQEEVAARQQADDAARRAGRLEAEAEQVERGAAPPVDADVAPPQGYVRMWRADTADAPTADPASPTADLRGTYFTPTRATAESYADQFRQAGHTPRLSFVDVPEDVARQAADSPHATMRRLLDPDVDEVNLPQEWARRARPVDVEAELPEDLQARRREFERQRQEWEVREAEANIRQVRARERRERAERLRQEHEGLVPDEDTRALFGMALRSPGGGRVLMDHVLGGDPSRVSVGALEGHQQGPLLEELLEEAGWQRQRRALSPDEVEREAHRAFMDVDRYLAEVPDADHVTELVAPSQEAVEALRIRVAREAIDESDALVDLPQRMRPYADAIDEALQPRMLQRREGMTRAPVGISREPRPNVLLGEAPDDPEDFAAFMRLLRDSEDVGWRVRYWSGRRHQGWRLENPMQDLLGDGAHRRHEGRQLAMSRMLRDRYGIDTATPWVRAQRGVSERGRRVAMRFGEAEVIEHEGVLFGTPDAMRRTADRIDAAAEARDITGNDLQAGRSAARKLRESADEVEELADQAVRVEREHPRIAELVEAEEPRPPQLEDFLDEGPIAGLSREQRRRVRTAAGRRARQQWDDVLRRQAAEGGPLPPEMEDAPRRVREAAERTQAEAVRAARQAAREADAQARTARERASELADEHRQAQQYLDTLDHDIEQVAADRDRLQQAAESIFNIDDVETRFERIDDLAQGLNEFHRRLAARHRDAANMLVDRSERKLASQQAVHADRLAQRAETLGRQMRTGREVTDDYTQWLEEQGLTPIGARGPDVERTPDLQAPPPELDMQYAPEVMRLAAERFWRGSRPDSEIQRFIDGVYRPWFGLFKLFATVARGPGYHIRNTIGGIWNNWLRDVSVEDHVLSAQLITARREAWRMARHEEAENVAAMAGINYEDAIRELPMSRVMHRAEQKLYEDLSQHVVHADMTLYDIHRAAQQQEIGWKDNRVFEGIHDMLRNQRPEDAGDMLDPRGWQAQWRGATMDEAAGAPANLWPTADPEDLNAAQRLANRMADNWWVDISKDWARTSEDFIRNAAFIRGAREYGLKHDGGRTASVLSRGLHFDYQDLSDFERDWMRGTLIPFYVWTRNNVPLQFRALFREPGKMHRLMMARDNAEHAFGNDDDEIIPSWMQERFGFTTMLGWKEDDDALLGYRFAWDDDTASPIILGIESPAYDLNRFVQFGGDQTITDRMRPATQMVSPAVGVPMELASGVSAFTGAPFSDQGVEAPGWWRVLPGAPTWEGRDGEVRAPEEYVSAVESFVPPLGQAERLLGTTDRSRERLPSSIAATLFAQPAATFTPRQQTGEIRARSGRLRGQIVRHPREAELTRELLDEGYTPEQIRFLLDG